MILWLSLLINYCDHSQQLTFTKWFTVLRSGSATLRFNPSHLYCFLSMRNYERTFQYTVYIVQTPMYLNKLWCYANFLKYLSKQYISTHVNKWHTHWCTSANHLNECSDQYHFNFQMSFLTQLPMISVKSLEPNVEILSGLILNTSWGRT